MGMLDGKIALITGAASGIGEATAKRFAAEGASVALCDIQQEAGERLLAEILDSGGTAIFLQCDVSQPESVKKAVEDTVEQFGKLDIVYANAGINGVLAPVDDIQPDEWDRTMEVNLKGTYLTVHYAVPHLKNAGGGSIIVTSSVNGSRTYSYAGSAAYSTSKAGQIAFMKVMAVELGRFGISCNAVCPGAIRTNIGKSTKQRNTAGISTDISFPKGSPALNKGWGHAEDVAGACLFLASDFGRHISGVEITLDGGASLIK